MIAENYRIGRNCRHIRERYFNFPVGTHLIFYRVEDEIVHIVRVLRQSMDVERQ